MLGKYEWELLKEMPRNEFLRWNALIELEYQENKAARRKADLKAKLATTR